MFARILYLTLALLLAAAPALAQPVTVIGPVTPGNVPIFNSPTVIKDSGTQPGGGGSTCTILGSFPVGTGAATQCSTLANSQAVLNGPLTINTPNFVLPIIPGEELLSPQPQVAHQMVATYAGTANPGVFGDISLLIYRPTTPSNSGNVGLFGDAWYDSVQPETGSLSAIRGDSYIIAQLTATIATGGTGNVVGDLLTIQGGSCGNFTTLRPIFRVNAVSGGVVTAASLYNKFLASCNVYPGNPVSTTSSNGGAMPPTLNLTNAAAPTLNLQIGVSGRPKNQSGGALTWMVSLYGDYPINASTGSTQNAAGVFISAPMSVTNPPTNSYGVFFNGAYPQGSLAAVSGSPMTFGVTGSVFYFSNALNTALTPPNNALMTISSNTGNIPALPLSGNVLVLAALDNSNTRASLLTASSTGGFAPVINFYHSRGTIAAPGATQNNDVISVVASAGYGTSYQTNGGAGRIAKATENFDATHGGTKLQLYATPNGSVTLAVAAELQAGMILGAPTGGDKGLGTLNATGLFVNNVAVLTTVAIGQVTGLGTGVATALGNATNSANGFCTYTFGTWTPTFIGDGTAGTPTYVIQAGSYEQCGRQVTVRFKVSLSGFTGATGNVKIGGLPVAAVNVANDFGMCAITSFQGWTAAAGFVFLTGLIVAAADPSAILLDENGSTKISQQTAVGEWVAAPTIFVNGVCSYRAS